MTLDKKEQTAVQWSIAEMSKCRAVRSEATTGRGL